MLGSKQAGGTTAQSDFDFGAGFQGPRVVQLHEE